MRDYQIVLLCFGIGLVLGILYLVRRFIKMPKLALGVPIRNAYGKVRKAFVFKKSENNKRIHWSKVLWIMLVLAGFVLVTVFPREGWAIIRLLAVTAIILAIINANHWWSYVGGLVFILIVIGIIKAPAVFNQMVKTAANNSQGNVKQTVVMTPPTDPIEECDCKTETFTIHVPANGKSEPYRITNDCELFYGLTYGITWTNSSSDKVYSKGRAKEKAQYMTFHNATDYPFDVRAHEEPQ